MNFRSFARFFGLGKCHGKKTEKINTRVRPKRRTRLVLEHLEDRLSPAVLPPALVDDPRGIDTRAGLSPQVAYDPSNPAKMVAVATTGSQLVIYYSTNSGEDWAYFDDQTQYQPPPVGTGPLLPWLTFRDPNLNNADNYGVSDWLALAPYAEVTTPSVAFDWQSNFYVAAVQHSADFTSGAVVAYKFDFNSAIPDIIPTGNISGFGADFYGNILYQWHGTSATDNDPAYNAFVAVDTNRVSYTDPTTGLIQTDTMANSFDFDPGPGVDMRPKAVYVAWNTDYKEATNAWVDRHSRIMLAASGDGGYTFTTPQILSSNSDWFGSPLQAADPVLAFTQGTSSTPGGQLSLLYNRPGGGQVWQDIFRPDNGNLNDRVADSFEKDMTTTTHINDATGGIIVQSAFPNIDIAPGATETSTINLPLGANVADVNVKINILHSQVGDLRVRLRSPNGTWVNLVNYRGGNGVNFTNTRFDDEAATPISAVTPADAPFTGNYRPETPLSGMDHNPPTTNSPIGGNWILEVRNNNPAGWTATLLDWELTVTPDASTPQITTSTITVNPGDFGNITTVTDLDLALNIRHANLEHVEIYLDAPNGRRLTLLQNRLNAAGQVRNSVLLPGTPGYGLGSGVNMGLLQNNAQNTWVYLEGTVFNDAAPRRVIDPNTAAPFIGHYRPESGWSTAPGGATLVNTLRGLFAGSTVAELSGVWRLTIVDYVSNTTAPNPEPRQDLESWKLHFTGTMEVSDDFSDDIYGTITPGGSERPIGGLISPVSLTATGSVSNIYPNTSAPAFGTPGAGPAMSYVIDNTLGSFSPYQGRMYLAYTAGNGSDTDVFVIASDNNGATWDALDPVRLGAPYSIRVNDDMITDNFSEGTRPQFMPTLTVDPATGTLICTYYDARYDPTLTRVATMVTTSIDGGRTWSKSTYLNAPNQATDVLTGDVVTIEPVPVDQSTAGPLGFGDRQGLLAYGGNVVAVYSGNGPTLQTATVNVAVGPRVIQGDMGTIFNDLNPNLVQYSTLLADGRRQLEGFEIVFDRPVDPHGLTVFGIAGVDTGTDRITLGASLDEASTGSSFPTGASFVYSSTASPIGGLVHGQTYYIIRVSPTVVRLATTLGNALAGIAVDLTSGGTGTQLLTPNIVVNYRDPNGIDTPVIVDQITALDPSTTQFTWLEAVRNIDAANDQLVMSQITENLPIGTRVTYSTTGIAAGGLVNGNNYYVINYGPNVVMLANSVVDALTGNFIDITDNGSGQHSLGITYTLPRPLAQPMATRFFVQFQTPQVGTGTYSYAVGPHVNDLVRWESFGLSLQTPVDMVSPSVPATTQWNLNTVRSGTTVVAGVDIPVGSVIGNVAVTMSINHPNVGALTVNLISPDGTSVQLVQERGGDGDNFTGTTFDDNATLPITDVVPGDAPFAASYIPEGSLGALLGRQADGIWQLEVIADYGIFWADATLTAWTLHLTPAFATQSFAVGNFMDQNNNGITAEMDNPSPYITSADDRFAIPRPVNGVPFELPYTLDTLPLMLPGPYLIDSSVPAHPASPDNLVLNATNNAIDLTFDRNMDPASFTAADVLEMVGPTGTSYGPFTVTPGWLDISSVDTGTDQIALGTATSLPTGTQVVYSTTGAAIGGLSNGNVYYLIQVSPTVVKLATTLANALAGTAIDLTGAGGGTQTLVATSNWPDIAGVDTVNDRLTLASSTTLPTGTQLFYSTTGAAIGGLANNTVYYLIQVSPTLIKLATSYANAQAGIAIDLTSAGSGTQILNPTEGWNIDRVNVTTEVITIGNGTALPTGTRVLYTATGLPYGPVLTSGALYYLINVSDTQVKLAASLADAQAGIAINLGWNVAGVNLGTEEITLAEPTTLTTGTQVSYASTGTAIGGLTSGNNYYLIVVSPTVVKLATSLANALAGTAINLTGAGTGTHHLGLPSSVTGTQTLYPVMFTPAPQRSFRIFFPTQTLGGTYRLNIGSDIRSAAASGGEMLDSNLNAGLQALTQIVPNPLQQTTWQVATGGIDLSGDRLTLTTSTNLGTGTKITYYTDGSAIGGLTNNYAYYLIRVSGTVVQLASTLANAQAGIAINLVNVGSGNHWLYTDQLVAQAIYGTSTPVPILANTGTPAISQIDITDNFIIQQIASGAHIQLQLNVSHLNVPDLEADLVAPDGTIIRLFTQVGQMAPPGSRNDFQNTTFDDYGLTPIQLGSPPFNIGPYNPQQPLSALVGKSTQGTWSLVIRNNGATAGTINNWQLRLPKASASTGLGEPVADRLSVGYRIYVTDPNNVLSTQMWTAVGPASMINEDGNRISGRVGGLAVDPSDASGNTVFMAGAGGGVWKTYNFLTTDPIGPTWIPLTDLGPSTSLNVGSIAVFARNNDSNQTIVFVATGEGTDISLQGTPGVGLLRSMDGGRTWQLLTSSNQNFDANDNILPVNSTLRNNLFVGATAFKVVVDPTPLPDGNVVVYAAFNGTAAQAGLWRSVNTGRTWTRIRAGYATDVVLVEGSGGGSNGNLMKLYAAFRGEGVFFTDSALSAMTLTQMVGGQGVPTRLNGGTPIPVTDPSDTPNGNKGRIVLAAPALTGNPLQDRILQGWVYAAVANADSTFNGLYVTKDYGNNWTKIRLPVNSLFPTNDEAQPDYDPVSSAGRGYGNTYMTLAVDPNNPSIVYLGGATGIALLRVDITTLSDPYAMVSADFSDPAGGLPPATGGSVPYYYNLLVDPDEPFLAPSTMILGVTRFNNGGDDGHWSRFYDALQRSYGQLELIAFRDPFTGKTRLIFGDAQGVYTGVDNGDGTVDRGIGTRLTPFGTRNGNLQTFQFYYGAAQPSTLAADVAGALFYGMSHMTAFPVSSNDAFTVGDLLWSGYINGAGGGVATDPTGTGIAYQYRWPGSYDELIGPPPGIDPEDIDFFLIKIPGSNWTSRNIGLLLPGDNPGAGVGQWPNNNATANFAINPADNTALVISAPNSGRVYRTQGTLTGQGNQWFAIGNPGTIGAIGGLGDVDNARKLAMAFGAPNPAQPGVLSDYIFVGSDAGRIFVTFTGGGAGQWRNISGGLDGSAIQAIVPNPQPGSREAYAITLAGVYWISNVETGSTWTRLSDVSGQGELLLSGVTGATAPQPVRPTWNNALDVTNVNTATETITLTRPLTLAAGSPVVYTTTGTAIGGLTQGATYYLIHPVPTQPPTNQIRLAATQADALAGIAIDLTGAGSGTQTINADLDATLVNLHALAVDWRFAIPDDLGNPAGPTHPVLYIGGEGGVFRSWDKGQSWTYYPNLDPADPNNNDNAVQRGGYFPNADVRDLDLSLGNIDPNSGMPNTPGGLNMLVATTFGRGSFAIRLDNSKFSQYLVAPNSGPRVLSVTPIIPNPGNQLLGFTVTFSGTIDQSSVDTSDFRLIDGGGNPIAIGSLVNLTGPSPSNVWQVNLASPIATAGNFTLRIGPDVYTFGLDITTNGPIKMDQNLNNINGEPADNPLGDVYVYNLNFVPNAAPWLDYVAPYPPADPIPTQQGPPGTLFGPIPFTVGDDTTPATSLVLTAWSSNTTLVPNGNIILGGAGAGRDVTIQSVGGQSGSTVITIRITDSQGLFSDNTFTVIANTAPTLNPIPSPLPGHWLIDFAGGGRNINLAGPPPYGNDPDGDPLTYTATAYYQSSVFVQQLDQQLGLYYPGSYYLNAWGMNEKWMQGTNSLWYCILPNGEVRLWGGSAAATLLPGNLIATLPSYFYTDPSLLWNSTVAPGTPVLLPGQVQVTGGTILDFTSMAPFVGSQAFVGTFTVVVTATDGSLFSNSQTITVTVTDTAPALNSIGDPAAGHWRNDYQAGLRNIPLAGVTSDPQSPPETLSYTAAAYYYTYEPAQRLDQQLGLYYPGSYYQNAWGMNEKWMLGTNNQWYCILPNGELRRWGGSAAATLQPANLLYTLPTFFYDDPSLLWDVPAPRTQQAYLLDQQLGLVNPGSNYYYNYRGGFEKYLLGAGNQWYFILPNGNFHRWNGVSLATSPLVATLNPIYHTDPSFLWNAKAPMALPGYVQVVGSDLSFNGMPAFVGSFLVEVKATDGALYSNIRTVMTTVTDTPPVLSAIADQSGSRSGILTLSVDLDGPPLSYGSDADGDPLTYSATAYTSSLQAYQLDQRLGLYYPGSYYQNAWGMNERWMQGSGGQWYCLRPVGPNDVELRRWAGNVVNTLLAANLIANLPTYIYNDPSLLWNAQAPTALPGYINLGPGNVVTFTPPANYVGTYVVEVTVNDGFYSAKRDFRVSVINNPPVFTPPPGNMTVSIGNLSNPITITASDPDAGDTMTLSATIVDVGAVAYNLNQQLALYYPGSYYQNAWGQNEKWLKSANNLNWYCILPNGEFRVFNPNLPGIGALVANLDPSYWADPSKLYNAQPPSPYANQVSIAVVMTSPTTWNLIITAPPQYRGTLMVTLTLSDGVSTTIHRFTITVTS